MPDYFSLLLRNQRNTLGAVFPQLVDDFRLRILSESAKINLKDGFFITREFFANLDRHAVALDSRRYLPRTCAHPARRAIIPKKETRPGGGRSGMDCFGSVLRGIRRGDAVYQNPPRGFGEYRACKDQNFI